MLNVWRDERAFGEAHNALQGGAEQGEAAATFLTGGVESQYAAPIAIYGHADVVVIVPWPQPPEHVITSAAQRAEARAAGLGVAHPTARPASQDAGPRPGREARRRLLRRQPVEPRRVERQRPLDEGHEPQSRARVVWQAVRWERYLVLVVRGRFDVVGDGDEHAVARVERAQARADLCAALGLGADEGGARCGHFGGRRVVGLRPGARGARAHHRLRGRPDARLLRAVRARGGEGFDA